MGLLVATRLWTMELTSGGRLVPWLGPAIRGTLAWAVKDAACCWPLPQRDGQYKTCRGCPHLQACPYGATFEAEPPAGQSAPSGMADSQRAVTIRPPFPAPQQGRPGDRLALCLTFLGPRAAAAAEPIGEILAEPGRALALGSDRVTFRLAPHPAEKDAPGAMHQIEPEDLPSSPQASAGRLPAVRVDLTTPLFLKEQADRGQKAHAVLEPTFGQLVRASLRAVGRAFAAFGGGGLEGRVDFAGLKTLAESIPTQAAFWQPFRQRHRSNRRDQSYDLVGVSGGAVFGPVPLCLVPWLLWGGRLGVGEHRICGAGCWQVTCLA
ncbi:MAG: hypothetical protein ACUVUC_16850 [Thermoguttaceae bacterium]